MNYQRLACGCAVCFLFHQPPPALYNDPQVFIAVALDDRRRTHSWDKCVGVGTSSSTHNVQRCEWRLAIANRKGNENVWWKGRGQLFWFNLMHFNA
jgi:hypothetical protein